MSDSIASRGKVIVCGAGLCGTLTALVLASDGYEVEVYERRLKSDMFDDSGRSFNITLTERGIRGLRLVTGRDLEQKAIEAGMKCFGRHVHPKGGAKRTFWTAYGDAKRDGNHFLLSISRVVLNKLLTRELIRNENIKVFFGHKCVNVDLDAGTVVFDSEQQKGIRATASRIIAADGCWSRVRSSMMRKHKVRFSQDFSEYLYKELYTPPQEQGKEWPYGGVKKADGLHIWPGDGCYLVAQPNPDKSYSTTIFALKSVFDEIDQAGGPDGVRAFFRKHFKTACPEMSTLEADYKENPIAFLKETRCYPYHYNIADKKAWVLLMGDAAHSVYPFLGQGTNAAFEDAYILHKLLVKNNHDWDKVCPEFTDVRYEHCYALADMAKEHGETLGTMSFSLVRWLRNKYSSWGGATTHYENVAFSNIGYNDCEKIEHGYIDNLKGFMTGLRYVTIAALAVTAYAYAM